MTKSGEQFALASPLQILWHSSTLSHVIYVHGRMPSSIHSFIVKRTTNVYEQFKEAGMKNEHESNL